MGKGTVRRSTVLLCIMIPMVAVSGIYIVLSDSLGMRMEFQTIKKGSYSGHTVEAYYVITDTDTWAELWSQHTRFVDPKPPLPEVDFSNSTIIAVFMGQRGSGGYGIEVKEIIDKSSFVEVRILKTYPKGGTTLAVTQPYHIVKVDKIDKPVIFMNIQ